MDAEKCLRDRQGVVFKGSTYHAKEFEVYTLGQWLTPLPTYGFTQRAFKKITNNQGLLKQLSQNLWQGDQVSASEMIQCAVWAGDTAVDNGWGGRDT